MKQLPKDELSARISRFIDRKMAKLATNQEKLDAKGESHGRRQIEVSASPYIQIAVR